MESRIMLVFYGADCLPYKDKERTVHYPVVGNAFNGANNTTQIRFYVKYIGGHQTVQWVVVSKLPNGQISNKLIDSANAVYDSEVGEWYLPFDLTSYYTSLKGEVFISLNGYQGGVLVEYDSDNDVYEISGTPTIQATGVIKIAINYAPQIIPGAFEPGLDVLQQIFGALSDKLDITNGIVVVPAITSVIDFSQYEEGQVFFDKKYGKFYQRTDTSPYYEEIEMDGYLKETNETEKVYGTDEFGEQTLYGVDSDIVVGTEGGIVVRRNPNTGNIIVGTPTNNDDATAKKYVDDGLATKVDKTNQASKLYGTDSDGNQVFIPIEDETGDVARRDSSGQLVVPLTPNANGNATSKKYVDDAISSALTSALTFKGNATVSQINALGSSATTGDFYNITDSGTITLGNVSVIAGDNVVWTGSVWDKVSGIDTTLYVLKSTTIAGVDLQDNITAQELTDALVYMNNTTDLDYVMED